MKHTIELNQIFDTNSYGKLKILKKLEKQYFLVEFIETGYQVTASRGNIIAGKVKDRLKQHHAVKNWEDVSIEMTNNSGDIFTIVKQNAKKCVVVFKETNHMTEAYLTNVKTGKISDPYKKSFLGIGYQGEFDLLPYWKPAKQLWSNMMKRCYNPKDEKGYFGKCFVDIRWHCFANFLQDIKELDGFDGWVNSSTTGIKYNLDKDLKLLNNKIYSKESCSFVIESYNKGATSRNDYYQKS